VTSILLLEFCVRNRAIRAQDVNDQMRALAFGSWVFLAVDHHAITVLLSFIESVIPREGFIIQLWISL
jgi:hypothetical protein